MATSAVLWTRVELMKSSKKSRKASTKAKKIKVVVSTRPDLKGKKAFKAKVKALPGDDFTVKVVATDLAPDTTYYYRWKKGKTKTEIGTFRTAPLPAQAASVRFTFSGDSDGSLVAGVPFFNDFEALDAARSEDGDFFVYLGDQIYSDSFVRGLNGMGPAVTLDEYRDTWRVNRSFPALTDLLASTSILSIWDDHEVFNDYDGQTVDPARYAAGRKAYFEYLPTLDSGLPVDPTCAGDPLFKVFQWGSLVDIIIPDERSCRSADVEAACLGDLAPTLPPIFRVAAGLPPLPPPGCLVNLLNPARTFLGPVQKQLFKDALLNSTAQFKIVVNELPIQQLYALPYDRWEGYAAERREILNFIRDNAISNVIFLSTDIHANLINDVFIDALTDPVPIATEFVTGPVARTTFADNVLALTGPPGLALVNFVFANVLGVECQALDAQAYGVVEIDAGAGTATVTLKDDTGAVLLDDLTALPCSGVVGP